MIALTANAIAGAREKFLNEGFADYIEKPVEKAVLERVLRRNIPPNKLIEVNETDIHETDIHETDNHEKEEKDSIGEEALIDLKKGDTYCGGRKKLLNILKEYVQRGRYDFAEMEQKIKEGDIKNYTILVHALKGFMASIGADKLSAMARDMETAGKRDDAEHIKSHQAVLRAEFEKVYEYICRLTGSTAEQEINDADLQEENAQEATVQKETAQEVAVQKETVQEATAQKGTAWEGTAQEGTAQEAIQESAQAKNSVSETAAKEQKAPTHENELPLIEKPELERICREFEDAVFSLDAERKGY